MQADVSAQDSVLSGRFAIQSVAGRGGMGTVYQARDLRADRDVAIKILHAQGAGPPGAAELARFQREAHVLASLRHPGIVSYVADGQTPEGLPFLAMEWLHGEDLAARLKRGPLSVAESLALLFAVADALAQAHQHGIVHRVRTIRSVSASVSVRSRCKCWRGLQLLRIAPVGAGGAYIARAECVQSAATGCSARAHGRRVISARRLCSLEKSTLFPK